MNIIEMKNINRYFGTGENRVHILKDISLNIEKGDFVAIIGQSGSGKSTLMNIIGCLDTATSGSYKIDDKETIELTADQLSDLRSQKFGFIFEQPYRSRKRGITGNLCGHAAQPTFGTR